MRTQIMWPLFMWLQPALSLCYRELRSGAQREAQHRQGATLRDADVYEGTKTKGQVIRMRNVKSLLEDKNQFLRAYDDKIMQLGLQVRNLAYFVTSVFIQQTREVCANELRTHVTSQAGWQKKYETTLRPMAMRCVLWWCLSPLTTKPVWINLEYPGVTTFAVFNYKHNMKSPTIKQQLLESFGVVYICVLIHSPTLFTMWKVHVCTGPFNACLFIKAMIKTSKQAQLAKDRTATIVLHNWQARDSAY